MSTFGGVYFTNKGRALQAKALTGVQLNFTRLAVGDGSITGQVIQDLATLIHEVKSIAVTTLKNTNDGKVTIGGVLTNQGLASGFYWRELGLFANDPELGEILYCYGNAAALAEYIPAGGGADLLEKQINIVAIVGNASNITATINQSLVYATQSDLENKVDKITGKGLSSNDYTTIEKNKLSGIEVNANNYAHPSTHLSTIIKMADNKTLEEYKSDVASDLADIMSQPKTDIQARSEIMDIKLKLEEQTAINFINKTGVGFYDTFVDNTGINTGSTTATYSPSTKSVDFTGSKILKMLYQNFDNFKKINVGLYPNKISKAIIKGDVNNSTTVITGATDKQLNVSDKLFMNGLQNEILGVTGNYININSQDTTVVASAYTPSASARPQRLSNGWIVSVLLANSNQLYFYVSKDNGVTWQQLCYSGSYSSITSISMCSYGTRIYVLGATSTSSMNLFTFDASTQTNIQIGITNNVDASQTAFDGSSLTVNSTGTELHACLTSKNALYPNSFNIRYAKGTINTDKSITWGGTQQITSNDTTGTDALNPCIFELNNKPYITIIVKSPNYYYVGLFTSSFTSPKQIWSTSPWGNTVIYSAGNYAQHSPSAIFVPKSINGLTNGRIWVAWYGIDETNSNNARARVSFSDDGGANWSSMQVLTTGTSGWAPSITANKNNEVFVTGTSEWSASALWYIKNTNGVWGTWVAIKTGFSGACPSTVYDPTLDFTLPLFIYKDTAKVGFYGTWTVGEGYTLSMKNPVTLINGLLVPIVDVNAKQGTTDLVLESIDTEKFNYSLTSDKDLTIADIMVNGKDTKLNAIAYAVS